MSIERINHHIHFLTEMTKAGIRMRNEGSFLGFFWYLLEPMIMYLILVTVFSYFNQNTVEYYSLYLLTGVILWHFFSFGTTRSIRVLDMHIGLIKSLNVPKALIILSGILVAFASHLFELVVLALFMAWYKVLPSHLLFFVWLELILLLWIFGISLLLASVFSYIRDIENIWNFIQQIWWFGTPIFYVLTPEMTLIRDANQWNPMFHIINESRNILLYGVPPNMSIFFWLTICSLLTCIIGYSIFTKASLRIAEMN